VIFAVGIVGIADDHTRVIERVGDADRPARERAEVGHAVGGRPDVRVLIPADEDVADDLPGFVDGVGVASRDARQRQGFHAAPAGPAKGLLVASVDLLRLQLADDRAAIVHVEGLRPEIPGVRTADARGGVVGRDDRHDARHPANCQ
jgi:hypothetical protein